MHHLIEDIGIVIIVATIIGIITHRLKQPIILGYLIAGIIVGPEIGRQLITEPENIEIISEIGLILLLFIIGLELNLKSIISSGKQLMVVGLGHIPEEIFAILIYTMAFTSIVSSYFIKYNNQIYHAFEHVLKHWGIKTGSLREEGGPHQAYPIVILGYHRGHSPC